MSESSRRGKTRLIHTAGTVVASPASLALAPVGSDAAAVDALLGTAGCGREAHSVNRAGFVASQRGDAASKHVWSPEALGKLSLGNLFSKPSSRWVCLVELNETKSGFAALIFFFFFHTK